MVEYRYARCLDGTVIEADKLAERGVADGEEFSCLACEHRLIAKVRGTQRRPHFAHHPGAMCSFETYLHFLGKQVFADVYNDCLARGEPFEIELTHPRVCRKFEHVIGSPCPLEGSQTKAYDLTGHYNAVRLEQREGDFVPDLLLFDRDRPELRIFVEIAVTHFLSEKKERSSERIIEIPMESEADLAKIRSRKLTEGDARFVRFLTASETVTDRDCKCAHRTAFAFIVFDSGKSVLRAEPLGIVESERMRRGEKIAYFRILDVQDDGIAYRPSRSQAFINGVRQAKVDGFPLKNCYLCRYQGDSHKGDPDNPVYCKCFKKYCNSNEAVSCSAFREKASF